MFSPLNIVLLNDFEHKCVFPLKIRKRIDSSILASPLININILIKSSIRKLYLTLLK